MSSQIPAPTVIYEDESLLVVDKPVGMVVHEGAGEHANLLTDWITAQRPEIVVAFKNQPEQEFYRPGIVHRLDKDTSGLIVIAKNPAVQADLQAQFKNRTIGKKYTTLVYGKPTPSEGAIETLIARNRRRKQEMSVTANANGKPAVTEYRTVSSYQFRLGRELHPITLLEVTLHSGRMHQIRVHMKHKLWPVIGDQTYKTKPSGRISKALGLNRQFLHASKLVFIHPKTGLENAIISPLPEDLQLILDRLHHPINEVK